MKKLFVLLCAFYALFTIQAQTKGGSLEFLLPTGFIQGISPNGQYAAGYIMGYGSFIWNETTGLSFLSDESEANKVADNGIFAGKFRDENYEYFDEWEGITKPLLSGGYYQNNQWHSLGVGPHITPPYEELSGSLVEGISADGTKIGGSFYVNPYMLEPVIWTNGVPATLEYDPVGQGARLQGLSADGTIACGWANPTLFVRQPVVWINGQIRHIKQDGVWREGECMGISPNGKYTALTFEGKAAIYNIETDEINVFGPASSSANAVSNDGIVVGYYNEGFMNRHAFIYTEQLGVMALAEYMEILGIAEGIGVNLETPVAMSADGLRIGGFGWEVGVWMLNIDEHLKAYNPPKNLIVTEIGFRKIALEWQAANPDTENTFVGYNVYRNDTKLNSTPLTDLVYAEENLPNSTYIYKVTAVWNSNEESIPTNKETINIGELPVPFLEDFSSSSLNTNFWNVNRGASERWSVSTWNGIPSPSVFYFSMGGTYSDYLLSPYIDATKANDLFLAFNLAPAYTWNDISKDFLKIELYDGTTWQTVHEFSPSFEYLSFEYHKFDISNIAAQKRIRIRFTASGENSIDNLMWGIDNVNVFDSENALVLSVPLRFTAQAFDDGTVHLNWADPGEVATLKYFNEESVINAIGNEGTPFIAAAKFDAKDLMGYYSYKMVSLSTFINVLGGETLPTCKLAVFQGSTRVVDQPILYTPNTWNTFTLDLPIAISADISEPIYYGIEVVTHEGSSLPVGICFDNDINGESPYVGRGNLYSEDGGQTWGDLMEFGIEGAIAVKANLIHFYNSVPKERLMGYKIFREGESLLGEDWLGNDYLTSLNNYTDLYPVAYTGACYEVLAFYNTQQESERVQFCLDDPIVVEYSILAVAGKNGTISPSGKIIVETGSSQTFEITPNEGYTIAAVLVNGVSVGAVESYIFENIQEDNIIEAFFNPLSVKENKEIPIHIFSNQNIVTIVNTNLIPVKVAEIYDIFGRTIWQGKVVNTKTEIALNVASGIYVVRIITNDNRQVTKKVTVY